jgi:putative aldouronate transport system substrate-binding protein
MRKLLLLLFVFTFTISLAACKKDETTKDQTSTTEESTTTTERTIDYDSDVTVNVALNYTSGGNLMSISYQKDAAYESLNGTTYTKGDLLPVWETIGEKLNINFVDKATSSDDNTNAQFARLQTEGFAGVDIVNGTGALIGPEGVNGNFVDIGKYLDVMPNLSAFLDANPAVKISMTAADGGIYFTPYFDGFGELELMFLARIDWIEDILDVENPTFDNDGGVTVPTNLTERQIATPIDVDITVANSDGSTRVVNKAYSTNILDTLAAIQNPTGELLAEAFRTHMENTYGDQGYSKLSEVFTGTDAAYDTDELLALMYVVKANPKYLTRNYDGGPNDAIEVFFPREGKGSRIRNLIKSTEMFGARGVISRHEYLYFDEEGLIQDSRYQDDFIEDINTLSHMYQDGLIVQNPEGSTNWRSTLLNSATGFMTFDYNASTTASKMMDNAKAIDSDAEFQAILPPVVNWLGDGEYFHFSESVRSVKNEAWGIPVGVEDDETKLYRILKLMDGLYDYSSTDSIGTIHLYGPEGWTNGTMQYGSDTVYVLSDDAKQEMTDLAGGNHINYLRQYVGATMPIGHIRSLGLEYQVLSDQGRAGIERINTAIAAGTFKLAGQVDSDNPWFDLSPTFYPVTKVDQDMITAAATFRTLYEDNANITLVKYGFSGEGGSLSVADYKELFNMNNIDVYDLIYIKAYRDAYDRIKEAE